MKSMLNEDDVSTSLDDLNAPAKVEILENSKELNNKKKPVFIRKSNKKSGLFDSDKINAWKSKLKNYFHKNLNFF